MQTIYTIKPLKTSAYISVAHREFDFENVDGQITTLGFSANPTGKNMAGKLGTVDGSGMPHGDPVMCERIWAGVREALASQATVRLVDDGATKPMPHAAKVDAKRAAAYDRVVNEGGEGFNPFRS